MAEIQYLRNAGPFSIITGAGYLNADQKDRDIILAPPAEITNMDIRSYNLYLYSNISLTNKVTLTAGVSGDVYEYNKKETNELDMNEKQLNPKLGITWDFTPGTTFRAAVFRTLRRRVLINQTLEPTQVAGFNQFFDDGEGSDSWRFGIAADKKFSLDFYGGMELSGRNIEVPYADLPIPPATASVQRVEWKEKLVRTYLYWTPIKWLSLSAEYQYEDLERDADFVGPELFSRIKTNRFPLGIGLFHPSGVSTWVKATHINQEGVFGDPFSGFTVGEDHFWIADAAVSYQFPKRLGRITFEIKNIFDEQFKFQDTDPANPRMVPERTISAMFTLSF